MKVHASNTPLGTQECDLLAVGVGEEFASELASLDAAFGGTLLPWVQSRKFTGAEGASLALPTLGRIAARELLLVGLGERTPRAVRVAAGKIGREARGHGVTTLGVSLPGIDADLAARALEWLRAGNYAYEVYKPETDRTQPVQEVHWLGALADGETDRANRIARWRDFGRDLINAPPADLTPSVLADRASELASIPGVTVEIWDEHRLAEEKCVGVLAVGQGSPQAPRLVHVRYRPTGAKAHIALVGKGVTFDSGGMSLKPSAGMQTMRCDMGGAATVLAATAAAADLGLPVAIDCVIGAVENMPDGNSYKLGDILRYRNGVTVEIHNTDAEGRLVLADCLIKACEEEGVTHVVDAATLTGACVIAVGPDFAGLFTQDEPLAASLSAAATAAVEGLWRLPLYDPYKQHLKGEWGQIKNVGIREGGASSAASFLQHFVADHVSWAHLDIAGSSFHDKGDGRYAAGATGEIVPTLVEWIGAL